VGAGKVLAGAGVYLDVGTRGGYVARATRKVIAPICFLAGLAVAALPALGADETVSATTDSAFDPTTVTINVGDTVTWNNAGGFHNVHFDDGSFVGPSAPSADSWNVSHKFSTAGAFRYYCETHGTPNGGGMSGTVVVKAAGTGTTEPPGGAPGPAPSPTQPADTVAPTVRLAGKTRQNVVRRRGLLVAVRVDEPATVSAMGRIVLPGASKVIRLRKVTRALPAGTTRKIKLRLAKGPLRAIERTLRRGVRLSARVTVTAKDQAGNVRTARRKVRLRG
jgi:plastocyanin